MPVSPIENSFLPAAAFRRGIDSVKRAAHDRRSDSTSMNAAAGMKPRDTASSHAASDRCLGIARATQSRNRAPSRMRRRQTALDYVDGCYACHCGLNGVTGYAAYRNRKHHSSKVLTHVSSPSCAARRCDLDDPTRRSPSYPVRSLSDADAQNMYPSYLCPARPGSEGDPNAADDHRSGNAYKAAP